MKIKSSIYPLQSPRSRSAMCNSDERFRFLNEGPSPRDFFSISFEGEGDPLVRSFLLDA